MVRCVFALFVVSFVVFSFPVVLFGFVLAPRSRNDRMKEGGADHDEGSALRYVAEGRRAHASCSGVVVSSLDTACGAFV